MLDNISINYFYERLKVLLAYSSSQGLAEYLSYLKEASFVFSGDNENPKQVIFFTKFKLR